MFNLVSRTEEKNFKILAKIRSWLCLYIGILSGILGLTGFNGILAYFLGVGFLNVIFYLKKSDLEKKFTNFNKLLYNGILTDLSLYVFVWIVFYNWVHVL